MLRKTTADRNDAVWYDCIFTKRGKWKINLLSCTYRRYTNSFSGPLLGIPALVRIHPEHKLVVVQYSHMMVMILILYRSKWQNHVLTMFCKKNYFTLMSVEEMPFVFRINIFLKSSPRSTDKFWDWLLTLSQHYIGFVLK